MPTKCLNVWWGCPHLEPCQNLVWYKVLIHYCKHVSKKVDFIFLVKYLIVYLFCPLQSPCGIITKNVSNSLSISNTRFLVWTWVRRDIVSVSSQSSQIFSVVSTEKCYREYDDLMTVWFLAKKSRTNNDEWTITMRQKRRVDHKQSFF